MNDYEEDSFYLNHTDDKNESSQRTNWMDEVNEPEYLYEEQ